MKHFFQLFLRFLLGDADRGRRLIGFFIPPVQIVAQGFDGGAQTGFAVAEAVFQGDEIFIEGIERSLKIAGETPL